MLPLNSRRAKIVLIDDDETYNAIMLRAADLAAVDLEVYTSLLALGSVSLLGRYDAVIVDYHLDQMTGIEVAEYLCAFFRNLPMILVSAAASVPSEIQVWPTSVASFIPKSAGYVHVIEQADRLARRPPVGPAGSPGVPHLPVVETGGTAYNFR